MSTKNPWITVALNLFVPIMGLGYLYSRQVWKFLVVFVGIRLLTHLVFQSVVYGVLVGAHPSAASVQLFGVWIWTLYDGYWSTEAQSTPLVGDPNESVGGALRRRFIITTCSIYFGMSAIGLPLGLWMSDQLGVSDKEQYLSDEEQYFAAVGTVFSSSGKVSEQLRLIVVEKGWGNATIDDVRKAFPKMVRDGNRRGFDVYQVERDVSQVDGGQAKGGRTLIYEMKASFKDNRLVAVSNVTSGFGSLREAQNIWVKGVATPVTEYGKDNPEILPDLLLEDWLSFVWKREGVVELSWVNDQPVQLRNDYVQTRWAEAWSGASMNTGKRKGR
jgi:hypothetical protein